MKVNKYTGIDDLPEGYLHLFQEMGSRSFFYSLPWFRNFVETTFDERTRVRIYGVERDDSTSLPVAALIMQYKIPPTKIFEPFKLSALSSFYTSLFGPLLSNSPYNLQEILGELTRAICSDTPRWDIVDLNPLDVDSTIFTGLVKSFKLAGMIVQPYFCFGNWYLQVKGKSYREYFETLPSMIKSTVKRKNKKLEKSGRARIEIITGMKDLEFAIEAYEKVYKASWKIREPYPHFIRGLIRTCAELGWLRLGLAYLDNEPAAAQLWIVQGGTASIYKLAYDERFSEFSIGSILTARLMEHVIDVDKVQEVDYLTGDDPYKKDWMSHRRERWGIMAFNPRTLNGILRIIRHVGGRALKTTWQGVKHKVEDYQRSLRNLLGTPKN